MGFSVSVPFLISICHIITYPSTMLRANTCHTIFIFMFFYPLTMSQNVDILKSVNRIIKDNCDSDCPNRCGLCTRAVCQDVVFEIGAFFLHCAEEQGKEELKREQ